jgi:hypothetical protein
MGGGVSSSLVDRNTRAEKRRRRPRTSMGGHYRDGPWGLIHGGVDGPEHRFAWPSSRPSSWLAWLSEIGWPTTQPVGRAQVGRPTSSPETTRRRHRDTGIRSSQPIFPTPMSCGRVKNTWRQQREPPRSTFSSPRPATSCNGRSEPTCSPTFRSGPSTGLATCGARIWNTWGDHGSSGSARRPSRAGNNASGGRPADQSRDRSCRIRPHQPSVRSRREDQSTRR